MNNTQKLELINNINEEINILVKDYLISEFSSKILKEKIREIINKND